MVQFALDVKRSCVFAKMGSGKTGAMLAVVDALRTVDVPPPIVLAPRQVAVGTWPAEMRKWFGETMRASVIVGTPEERLAAVHRSADLYVTNYDNVQWLMNHVGASWPWTSVIADESTRLKGFRIGRSLGNGERARGAHSTKRAAELARVAFSRVRRWTNLTGTPYGQGFLDLWGQMWFIDRGERLGYTFSAYRDRWFGARPAGLGGRLKWSIHEHSPNEILDRIKDVAISIDPADYFDLPDLVVNPVYVDLPAKSRAIYRRAERELILDIERGEIGIAHAGAKMMKLAQICNGAVYPELGAEAEHLHDEKLHALRSIVEEANGMPVLVAYEFQSDLARILKAFPEAKTFNSSMPSAKVNQIIDEWNAGRVPMLVLHPKSAGHGLNLQDGSCIAALFGQTNSLEGYQQFIERIGPTRQMQAGHPRTVWIHSILARDTVDELHPIRRETGAEMIDLFMERTRK